MNKIITSSFLLLGALSLLSCENDDLQVTETEVPTGFAPSAGISTVYMSSSLAYDQSSPWVTGQLARRFQEGDGLYDDPRSSADGLGPVYAGYACGSCHSNAGRNVPAVWTKRKDGA